MTKWKTWDTINPEKYYGFVYKITNEVTGKFYIGKKVFWNNKKHKLTKKQLAEQTKAAKDGKLTINLNLTSPVSLVEHYDELVEMFEIDVREELTLTQQEYNEYYKDKTENTRHAMLSNAMYLGD